MKVDITPLMTEWGLQVDITPLKPVMMCTSCSLLYLDLYL